MPDLDLDASPTTYNVKLPGDLGEIHLDAMQLAAAAADIDQNADDPLAATRNVSKIVEAVARVATPQTLVQQLLKDNSGLLFSVACNVLMDFEARGKDARPPRT